MYLKLSTALVATFLLGGCITTTGTAAIDACEFWRPISWSVKDTPETVEGVKINNVRQKAWCNAKQATK